MMLDSKHSDMDEFYNYGNGRLQLLIDKLNSYNLVGPLNDHMDELSIGLDNIKSYIFETTQKYNPELIKPKSSRSPYCRTLIDSEPNTVVTTTQLYPKEKQAFIKQASSLYSNQLSASLITKLCFHAATADPLFLSLVTHTLLAHHDSKDVDAYAEQLLAIPTNEQLFRYIVKHLDSTTGNEQHPNPISQTLANLAVSPFALRRWEIAQLLGQFDKELHHSRLPEYLLASVIKHLKGFCLYHDGKFQLAHPLFKKFTLEDEARTRQAHRQIPELIQQDSYWYRDPQNTVQIAYQYLMLADADTLIKFLYLSTTIELFDYDKDLLFRILQFLSPKIDSLISRWSEEFHKSAQHPSLSQDLDKEFDEATAFANQLLKHGFSEYSEAILEIILICKENMPEHEFDPYGQYLTTDNSDAESAQPSEPKLYGYPKTFLELCQQADNLHCQNNTHHAHILYQEAFKLVKSNALHDSPSIFQVMANLIYAQWNKTLLGSICQVEPSNDALQIQAYKTLINHYHQNGLNPFLAEQLHNHFLEAYPNTNDSDYLEELKKQGPLFQWGEDNP